MINPTISSVNSHIIIVRVLPVKVNRWITAGRHRHGGETKKAVLYGKKNSGLGSRLTGNTRQSTSSLRLKCTSLTPKPPSGGFALRQAFPKLTRSSLPCCVATSGPSCITPPAGGVMAMAPVFAKVCGRSRFFCFFYYFFLTRKCNGLLVEHYVVINNTVDSNVVTIDTFSGKPIKVKIQLFTRVSCRATL